jgi:hypothetical protein
MSAHDTPATVTSTTTDVEIIKADIERTQAALAGTVAELQRKLKPSHILERAKENARQSLRRAGDQGWSAAAVALTRTERLVREARERLRQDPTPAVLVGAGFVALLWHRARRRRSP